MSTTAVTPTAADNVVLHGEIIDPRERAEARFSELQKSFARTLFLLAHMHSDEDWRWLKKDDGSDYKGFTELVAVALECSASYARRYAQGITGLYLPLQEIVVEGTAIEITSSDVAILGTDGARNVVAAVAAQIESIEPTPEAHTGLVHDAIAEEKQQQKKPSNPSPSYDDGRADPADEAGESSESFDAIGGDSAPNGADTPPSQFDEPAAKKPKKKSEATDPDDDDSEYEPGGRGAVGDPLDRALVNCRTYSTEDEIAEINNVDLQSLRRSLNAILRLDVDDVADAISSELRGVLADSGEAIERVKQIRNVVQTRAAWVKK